MTKKDFIVIAKVLRVIRESGWTSGTNSERLMQYVVGAFVGELILHNPKFDAVKFRKAVFDNR